MNNKIELQVISITNSQAQIGAFAMLLGEVNGERQLPIIIGPAEAQATALYLKGLQTPRPLTHDLFTAAINVLGANLLRVLIYKAEEGIFYSYIYLKKENEIIRMDARTSDAIALAVRAGAPFLSMNRFLKKSVCASLKKRKNTKKREEIKEKKLRKKALKHYKTHWSER